MNGVLQLHCLLFSVYALLIVDSTVEFLSFFFLIFSTIHSEFIFFLSLFICSVLIYLCLIILVHLYLFI